jgi:SPOR domain
MPPGYPPQGGKYVSDGVPPTSRQREPSSEAPSRRPAAAPAAGARPNYGYAQDGYGQDPYAETGSDAQASYESDDDAEDDYETELAPKGHKGRIVLATLLAAVVIGGGLGYAYKLSTGGANKTGALPTVQAEKAPSKAIPVDAGGQKFESGKKILDRANADGTPPADSKVVPSQEQVAVATDTAGGQADAIAGPRKVPTVVVKPGVPIEASAANASAAAMQDEGVPGISLGETDAPAAPANTAVSKPKGKAAAPQVAVVDQAVDATATADAAVAETAQQPTKLAGATTKSAKKVAKTVVAAITPADVPADGTDPAGDPAADAAIPAQTAKPKTASAKLASGGYIIQVRSTKTQADSLAYFADLQQRYGDLLGAAQPDIQEVDLGAKGKWFRLRIGPPGSGAAAKDLCGKLKTGGLKDCIVAAY